MKMLTAAVALLLAFPAVAAPETTATEPKAKPDIEKTEKTTTTPPMVTPEWVAQHYKDADVRILDVRPDVHQYFTGHVPGAVYFPEAGLRGPAEGMPVQYLPTDMKAKLFERAGINNRTHVVVYSDGENVLGATMVAYALERMGHTRVSILEGGFAAYTATQKTTQEYPKVTMEKMTPKEQTVMRASLEDVKTVLNKKNAMLVDVRPEKAYLGEVDTWARNGHIPGAINVDWHSMTVPTNMHKLKTADELRKMFEAKGITKDKNVILYCGTSREASLSYFALKRVLNYPNVRLYEGSWTEWAARPDLPIEKGMTTK